jgi:hypothetical protein
VADKQSETRMSRMTNGFALISLPASYGASAMMTFIVNQDGIVPEGSETEYGDDRGRNERRDV